MWPQRFVTKRLYHDGSATYTRQHVGAPAMPCVSVGEHVVKGQVIGQIPADALGAAIHSSIDGTVSDVTQDYIEVRSV